MENVVLDFRKTRFVTSSPDINRLPPDRGAEIAFAGRSNSGKSSALNAICDQVHLAKTSRTPGRTRLINLFEVAPGCSLVDLPGYGYAAVSESMKREWQKSLSDYLQKRKALRGIVVLMDIRHPLKDHDRLILDWSIAANLPALILLTKCDKLGVNARRDAVQEVKHLLSEFGSNFTVIAFSSWSKLGLDETRHILNNWFTTFHGSDYDPETLIKEKEAVRQAKKEEALREEKESKKGKAKAKNAARAQKLAEIEKKKAANERRFGKEKTGGARSGGKAAAKRGAITGRSFIKSARGTKKTPKKD